jgi:uncharacterized protein YprB with RNaseH-like and TPR domain
MDPHNFCALDIETAGGQWATFPDGFDLLLTGIRYEDEYFAYTAEPESLAAMADFLNSFEGVVVTFNGIFFDVPLLKLFCTNVLGRELDVAHHYDILAEVKNKAGRRISLDQLSNFTFGAQKMPWDHRDNRRVWAEEPQRLVDYNKVDLDLTTELYQRVLRNEHLFLGTDTITLPLPTETGATDT